MRVEVQRNRRSCSINASVAGGVRLGTQCGAESGRSSLACVEALKPEGTGPFRAASRGGGLSDGPAFPADSSTHQYPAGGGQRSLPRKVRRLLEVRVGRTPILEEPVMTNVDEIYS